MKNIPSYPTRLILLLIALPWGILARNSSSEDQNHSTEISWPSKTEDFLEQEKAQTSPSPALAVSSFSTENEKWIKGRILVQPKAGVNDQIIAQALSAHGGKSISKIASINVHVVEIPSNANEKAVAALLAKNPHFEFAEVDIIVKPNQLTNDTYFPSQWHLPKINAPEAWDSSTGSGVIIAILDSGIDVSHPDLASRIVPGYNFYDNNSNITDTFGHGTMCAGTAAAIGNNSVGTAGVAWNSQIMPIKVTDVNGWA